MLTRGNLRLRALLPSDLSTFADRASTFEKYLVEQETGLRWVRVAVWESEVAGYVTLLWVSEDRVLRDDAIPEISDLKVLAPFRRRGIGTALLDEAEAQAATRSKTVGLNVGLHSGYVSAQRLYVRRGYLPDGSGVVIDGATVPEGATITLMDDRRLPTLRMTKSLA